MKDATSFSVRAQEVTASLRASIAGVVGALPGPIENPTALQRVTKLSTSLSWAIYHAATCDNSISTGLYVPKREAMRTFLNAARRLGVPEDRVRSAQAQFEEFERFSQEHAGDRGSFEMMVSDLARERNHTVELRHRRNAFRALRHVAGHQVRAIVVSNILAPNPEHSTRVDTVVLSGRLDVRQLRLHKEVLVESTFRVAEDAHPPSPGRVEPLLPGAAEPDEACFIPQFCSTPLPKVRVRDLASGGRQVQLLARDIGAKSEFSFLYGRVHRSGTPRPTPQESFAAGTAVSCPAMVLIQDLVIHSELLQGCSVFAKAYQYTSLKDMIELDDSDLLPDQPRSELLGRGAEATSSADYPQLESAVRLAMDRMGWNHGDFQVFRCRIEYPMLSSVVKTFIAHDGD